LCVSRWVDRASAETGIRLTALERRRLIAALLSRRHLILSGPTGIGKRQLAYELALAITNGQQGRVCWLQGHPWWATGTGDVGFFVNLQTSLSAWQLAYFTESILNERMPATQHISGLNHGSRTHDDTGEFVVGVERMSRFEIELYYSVYAAWLIKSAQAEPRRVSTRLIGTYDCDVPPDPSDFIVDLTAVIHLSGAQRRTVTSPLAPLRKDTGW
jgi:DNA polymerase III delta prime subunit